jgi:septum formation protein
MQYKRPLILASMSPRRARLLRQIGIDFTVDPAHINEDYDGSEPVEFAREMSRRKASEVASRYDDGLILGADTIVLFQQRILGKPGNAEEARKMLLSLSGAVHEVITGVTIIERPTGLIITDHELTRVWFRTLSENEIERYIESGSPFDKAGGYGIQDDHGAVFVSRIDGCYYNVVGLPLSKVDSLLNSVFRI